MVVHTCALPIADVGGGEDPGREGSVEVEEVLEERAAALGLVGAVVVVATGLLVAGLGGPPWLVVATARGHRRRRGPLDDLVELAPVEPHPAALGAEVDLYPLAAGDRQGHVAHGALHLVEASAVPGTTRRGQRPSRAWRRAPSSPTTASRSAPSGAVEASGRSASSATLATVAPSRTSRTPRCWAVSSRVLASRRSERSEEHTSELQ